MKLALSKSLKSGIKEGLGEKGECFQRALDENLISEVFSSTRGTENTSTFHTTYCMIT